MTNNNFYGYSPYNQVSTALSPCSCHSRHQGCFPVPPCPPGPPGPPGATASSIPFSIGQYGISFATDEQGNPLEINFAGFGSEYVTPVMLQPGEWPSGIITFREYMPFGASFIMPHDAKLRSIYVVFSTSEGGSEFEQGAIITPFACLAVASPGVNLIYTVLQNTITDTQPYMGGVFYPKHTLRRGSLTGLNIPVTEGSLLGIVLGIRAQNITEEQFGTLSASGGLYFA